jgi:DNA-binding XRE family transcriptional regulator
MQIGEKEMVGIELRDYKLVEQRLLCYEIFLVLLKVIVPDLQTRIDKVDTASLREKLNKFISENSDVLERPRVRPSRSIIERGKRNFQCGEFVSLPDFKKQIAVDEIRDARKKAGMTQRDLAKKAGLSQPQLSRLEKNPRRASMASLRKVASVLGVALRL